QLLRTAAERLQKPCGGGRNQVSEIRQSQSTFCEARSRCAGSAMERTRRQSVKVQEIEFGDEAHVENVTKGSILSRRTTVTLPSMQASIELCLTLQVPGILWETMRRASINPAFSDSRNHRRAGGYL